MPIPLNMETSADVSPCAGILTCKQLMALPFIIWEIYPEIKLKQMSDLRRFYCGSLTCWVMGSDEGPGRCCGSRLGKIAPLATPTVASVAERRSPLARPGCAISPCARPNTG